MYLNKEILLLLSAWPEMFYSAEQNLS